ncbi:hypothetical protein [Janthinobacterium sp. B9-8]|uniref:hypothetical protein n=1 Tax=Janthinobacterium sp. B9-8 TaxID=1236179 RepID=UPI00061D3645|nr:hypothetical protein [Janthinobacterium sp. B9-8]AMC33581.1 hypothetical protein VN23_02690 [Janthinobacterium sp. B9-8]
MANVTSVFTVLVDFPNMIKATEFEPWNEWTETFYGGLQCGKDGVEFSVNGVSVTRPFLGLGVKTNKESKHAGSEGRVGGNAAGVTISPEREAMRGERGKENSSESYQCGDYCGLYFPLPLWVMGYWIALSPAMR